MKVVIRADASDRTGSGHIMRCRMLARALARRGAEILFVCRREPGHLIALLDSENWAVAPLPADSPLTETDDGAATAAVLGPAPADWLVVDHYGLGAAWEGLMRPHARRILAIDDTAERAHDCDLLLDQNFSSTPDRYAGLLSSAARTCLGPRYALLGEDYAALPLRPPVGEVRRILVSFGGADLPDMTGLTLAALDHPMFAGIALDLVVGRSYPHRVRLEAAAAARPGTTVLGPQPTLSGLLAAADLAVGAGGITTWERGRAGVPSVVITLAENQVPATRDLATLGAIRYVGPAEQVTADQIRAAVAELRDAPALRQRMTEIGQQMVDGLGARRMAERVSPSADDAFGLRPATAADRGFYFDLANDPDVRRQSFSSAPIPWEEHCAWFARKLQDPDTALWVLEADGLPLGQIRFDRTADHAVLSYALDPVARGRGWGKKLVMRGVERLMRAGPLPITAEVKPENAASRRVFETLGFALTPGAEGGKLVYRLQPSNQQ